MREREQQLRLAAWQKTVDDMERKIRNKGDISVKTLERTLIKIKNAFEMLRSQAA